MRPALVPLLVVALLATSGCIGPGQPRFDIAITPMHGEAPMLVDVAIVAPDTYRFASSNGCHDYVVEVQDLQGSAVATLYTYDVWDWPPLCTDVETDIVLQPGRTNRTFHWNGHVDRDPADPWAPHVGPRVAPGSYVIVARSLDLPFLHAEVPVEVR